MKLFQALTAISLCLGMTQAWAVEGPDLSRDDLDVLSHQNLRKGPWVLSPVDAQARKNIAAARQHMEFDRPQLMEDTQTSHFRYKVNPNSDQKIEEIWLKGSKIEDLHVVFSAPSVARWDIPYQAHAIRIEHFPSSNDWMFSLGVQNLSRYKEYRTSDSGHLFRHSNGSYILEHWGTSSPDFGWAEKENWWFTYVSFNPSQDLIQTGPVTQSNGNHKTISYIKGERISRDDFETLLKNKTITLVREENPFLNPNNNL